jgi:hypothetical protein
VSEKKAVVRYGRTAGIIPVFGDEKLRDSERECGEIEIGLWDIGGERERQGGKGSSKYQMDS